MSTEENKTLIRRWIEETNKGNVAVIDEIFATSYVHHDPADPEIHNLKDFKRQYTRDRTAFSDIHVTIEDIIAEGDRVVVRSAWHGTQRGQMGSLPTIHKKVMFISIGIFRVASDKIIESWLLTPLCQEKKNWLRNALQRWLIPLVAFGLIIVHMIWSGLIIDAITLGLLVIMILPWLSTILENARLPGGWELTFRKIEAVQEEQKKQQSDIETQRSQIRTLSFLLNRLVSGFEIGHLNNLLGPKPFEVNYDPTTGIFKQELRHLLGLGFIERKPGTGVRGLEAQLKAHGRADVKEHFSITDKGKEYLELLQAYETEEQED